MRMMYGAVRNEKIDCNKRVPKYDYRLQVLNKNVPLGFCVKTS